MWVAAIKGVIEEGLPRPSTSLQASFWTAANTQVNANSISIVFHKRDTLACIVDAKSNSPLGFLKSSRSQKV